MKILKASAGSGKTYQLSKTYLDLLLKSDDPCKYRHILAVTFTNKATAEMKARILRDLYSRSGGNDEESRVARKYLINILHDYGAFSISTIDRFFQLALRSFSREIGQLNDYQIELDRKSLIQEAMDRVLDSLEDTGEKRELIDWINRNLSEEIERGNKPGIESALLEMGENLKSEEHRTLSEEYARGKASTAHSAEDYSKEHLAGLRKACAEIKGNFLAEIRRFGIESGEGETVSFDNRKRLLAKEPELKEIVDRSYRAYMTACIVEKLILSLGVAREFYREFDELLKEKNVMCLDESNTLLRDIINGSDTPFVYEKLGVRYEDFLLDEFQDTSNIQYENFKPLLAESEGHGGSNLMVGDVKQSIYRFRDSDWKLLAFKVERDFTSPQVEVLGKNWRSAERIVRFNNAFFTMAAEKLGLGEIYSDVKQEPVDNSGSGLVRVTFTDSDSEMAAVLESVRAAREAGAGWRDIAILVRNAAYGSRIAAELIDQKIPVISDDSLSLDSSPLVRRLIALLRSYENPEDGLSAYLAESMEITIPESFHSLVDLCELLLRAMYKADPGMFEGQTPYIQAFMDDVLEWSGLYGSNVRRYLKHWENVGKSINSPENSQAVRIMTIHKSKGLEFPYLIFPFAEKVDLYKSDVHWCRLDGDAISSADSVISGKLPPVFEGIYPVELGSGAANSYFSEAYESEKRKQVVDNMNIFYVALTRAVKVLHVISAPVSKSFRDKLAKGKAEYKRMPELLYEYVTAKIAAPGPMETVMDNTAEGKCDYSIGKMYDFRKDSRKDSGTDSSHSAGTPSEQSPQDPKVQTKEREDFSGEYVSIDMAGRLRPSVESSDFFNGEDAFDSPRLSGIVLHEVLSRVATPEDVAKSVSLAVAEGKLPEESRTRITEILTARVKAHREWFPDKDGAQVYNERAILDAKGKEHRPDRVLFSEDGVDIVDFKFGKEQESYVSQLRAYAGLYGQMGYKVKSAVLWYVNEDRCRYVTGSAS